MRAVVRTLIAVFLASVAATLAAPAVRAHAQETGRQSADGTYAASSHSLTISIDTMSPRYATPTSAITVSGTLSNHTGSAISGIVVQVETVNFAFITRSTMDSFLAGRYGLGLQAVPVTYSLPRPLRDGATTRWSISFPGQALNYYSGFGVYPVQAVASTPSSSQAAVDRTFLPYWPGGAGSATRMRVAWIWPLVDSPQQGACPQTLATDDLAGELKRGGRLSALVQAATQQRAGQSLAQRDHLTWAVDPALLSDVSQMTHPPYFYGGNAICTGRVKETQASGDAVSWLASLKAVTAGQPAFLTPYADVDAAALSHAGLDDNLTTAYRIGKTVAAQILPQTFGASGSGNEDGAALPAAWPAGGTADSGVLTSLASDGGVRAVVLRSGSLPSAAGQYDDALGLTRTDNGTKMPALLADQEITSVLGSATASSPPAARFAAEQDFLALTAMMVAEAPSKERSLVVAPPRQWSPSADEASTLLRMTSSAPWLRPAGLSQLAADSRHLSPQRLPARQVSGAELGGTYLSQVGESNSDLALYKDLLYQPGQAMLTRLDAAVLAAESAAWRDGGARATPGGWLALTKLDDFINDNENKVRLIAGKKILLAGTSGATPVSVQNGLPYRIRITVTASAPTGGLLISPFSSQLTINPRQTATTRIPLRSTAIVTTMMRLQLETAHGLPLTWTGTSQQMSVQVTRYGRTLLALIGAALGVVVLASAARWYRRRSARGRNDGTDRAGSGGTG